MEVDLRDKFKEEREWQGDSMREGHRGRFLQRLEKELPTVVEKKKGFSLGWKIAASLAVLFGLTLYFTSNSGEPVKLDPVGDPGTDPITRTLSLGDLSPDFKKIETYYTTNINLQLSELLAGTDHRELVESYLEQLGELDAEYQRLNLELNQLGPNDQTIGALVRNLQIRLELLQRLKSRIDQLKSSKNEQSTSDII